MNSCNWQKNKTKQKPTSKMCSLVALPEKKICATNYEQKASQLQNKLVKMQKLKKCTEF